MKALVISDFRRPHAARPEAEIFLSLHRQGVSLDVMTTESEYARRFRDAGIRVISFAHQKNNIKGQVKQIRAALRDGNYDILHLLSAVAIKCGIRAARGSRVKVIVYRGANRVLRWYDPAAYRKHLHPRVHKIVCNSHAVAQGFHRQLFFNKNKTIVIHKGHDPAWYRDVKPANLTQYGIPGSARVAICVANNRPVKGVPVLLEAIARLPDQPEIHVLLVGEGMHEQLTANIPRRLRGRVHALGYIESALSHIAASDVLVLPSLFSESLTKSVQEAMHLGVAPIITDLPGNGELLVDGESGLKVPPGDPSVLARAILRVCSDGRFRDDLARNARDRVVSHFSHEDTVRKMLELYRTLSASSNALT